MNQAQKINDLIRKCESERFFGQITLQFRSGQIELVRQESTFKLFGDSRDQLNR